MTPLTHDDRMPFGKYQGLLMRDLPAEYLHFLWQAGLKKKTGNDVADYIRRNLDALRMENTDLIWT